MSVNISGDILSASGYTPNSEILDPNVVTDGLVAWYDPGNLYSYQGISTYYDCGYGCQYYSSDPGCTHCNTQIKDMSGYANDGTLNTTTVTYDNTGGSMIFNGSSNYVSIPGLFMNVSTQYSISMWFKKASTTPQKVLITKDNTTTLQQYGIYWDPSNVFSFVHALNVNGGVIITFPSFNCNVIGTGWHHVVASWDGSNINLYGDGVAATPVTAATGYAYTDVNRHSIGRYGGYNGWYFDGNIANTLIYNKALSYAEVVQNFNDGRQRFGV